ncbi:phage head closure protein [Thauera humireducens]|uniref:phage head closure protein n=1 Tax=Thauera humireducens TaxID=1134435 RepID=UPI00311E243C
MSAPRRARTTGASPSKDGASWPSTWASVEPLTGRELFAAQAAQSETTYRLTTRYMAGVDASCRVLLDDGRILGIVAVIDLRNQHRYMQFLCRELT